ncbi:hypothetical protein [Paraburkholderia sp. BR14320]|uniref:hypothetical protein n=1 Tax=unclassified Paraburkholderia TaxID=2615204 RepID=UPI0034CF2DB9
MELIGGEVFSVVEGQAEYAATFLPFAGWLFDVDRWGTGWRALICPAVSHARTVLDRRYYDQYHCEYWKQPHPTHSDGDFCGRMEELTHLCDIEGNAEAHDRRPSDPLKESLRVLDISGDKYTIPRLAGTCFTVFIGRMRDANVTPLVRLDVDAHNGQACAYVVGIAPGWTTEPVYYCPDDDVVEIVRKILAGQCAA